MPISKKILGTLLIPTSLVSTISHSAVADQNKTTIQNIQGQAELLNNQSVLSKLFASKIANNEMITYPVKLVNNQLIVNQNMAPTTTPLAPETYQKVVSTVEHLQELKPGKRKPKPRPKGKNHPHRKPAPKRDKTLPPAGDPINNLLFSIQNYLNVVNGTNDGSVKAAQFGGNIIGSIAGIGFGVGLGFTFSAITTSALSGSLPGVASFAGAGASVLGGIIGWILGEGIGLALTEVLRFAVALNSPNLTLRTAAQKVVNAIGFNLGSKAIFPDANV